MSNEITLGDGTTKQELKDWIEEEQDRMRRAEAEIDELPEDDPDFLREHLEDDLRDAERKIEEYEYGIHHIECREEEAAE